MTPSNEAVIEAACKIVEMLNETGVQISIDGHPYIVQTTKDNFKPEVKELYIGGKKAKPIEAMWIVSKYHDALTSL